MRLEELLQVASSCFHVHFTHVCIKRGKTNNVPSLVKLYNYIATLTNKFISFGKLQSRIYGCKIQIDAPTVRVSLATIEPNS